MIQVPFVVLQLFLLLTMILMSRTSHAVHLSFAIPLLASNVTTSTSTSNESTTSNGACYFPTQATIPTQLSSVFSSYPNVLCITEAEQQTTFHPVLFFPIQCWKKRTLYSNNSKEDDLDLNNNKKERSTKATFVCPATDFTSTTSSSSSKSSHYPTSDRPNTVLQSPPPPPEPKKQLLSVPEFQESQRRRRRILQSSEERPLQKIIHSVLQNIQHNIRYPFRYVIPSIQYFLDHSYSYQYLKRLCWCWLHRTSRENKANCYITTSSTTYIGRYDEDRIGLYTSDLFRSNEKSHATVSGTVLNHTTGSTTTRDHNTCEYRSVHVGIDLSIGGRVGTPVYAFTDGHIHSVGYNPELGDYGNVIVVHHYWYRNTTLKYKNQNTNHTAPSATNPEKVILYALYGHLSDRSIKYKQTNDTIRRGQIIGYIGNVYENGGWYTPHLHFQLSTLPPDMPHDMPGAICYQDRIPLLYQYFDPRYVLGTLH
jgi:murein DD-endopeptidase MepM/ murein hydrolase activator NlpD